VLGDHFDPKFEPLRRNMGYTLRYARKMNLAAMTPHGELASTEFCLADPGREYLVYLPKGGEVTVDLSAASGAIAVEWLDPRSGDTTPGERTFGDRKRSFKPPFDGDAVLYLLRRPSPENLHFETRTSKLEPGAEDTIPQVRVVRLPEGALVKWALYGSDGVFTGKQGTIGVSTSGTKATAFTGWDGAFYVVTMAE
jgi:hypothetical protein